MPHNSTHVIAAMTNAGVEHLDERGLMPIERARDIVGGASEYRKGVPVDPAHPGVLEADVLWAALLSLSSAEEFLDHAHRLTWHFHVRGLDNTALYDRYGDDVLGWVGKLIDDKGVLRNVPWCLWPTVMASDSREAYEIAYQVRGLDERIEGTGPSGPRQDVDETWALIRWVMAHPDPGLGWLADDAESEEHAGDAMRALGEADPSGLFRELGATAGRDVAEKVFEKFHLMSAPPSDIAVILDVADTAEVPLGKPVSLAKMDVGFAEFDSPMWDNANYFCGGWRVMGFAHASGDLLVFQSLVTGLGEPNVRLEIHAYGPLRDRQPVWANNVELIPEDKLSSWEGDDIILHPTGVRLKPDGSKVVPEGGVRRKFDVELPNGKTLSIAVGLEQDLKPHFGPVEAVMIRMASNHADDVFLGHEALIEQLHLPADVHVLFTFDEWEHPAAGLAASSSMDIRAMTEALGERRAIEMLPIGTSFEHYIDERAALGLGWGEDGWA